MAPEFFLVGAPRSGTTALCNYLRVHPEVFVCSPKEPTFFGRDLVPKRYPTMEKYLALFAETGSAHRVGDGSVAYLCSDFAAEEIHAFNPSASILMILRNPVDMIVSLHRKHYLMGIEPCRLLEEALDAEDRRLSDGTGVPEGVCPKVIALRRRASYAQQLERFLNVFPRSQIKVFLFDDFQADAQNVYRETCRFLGVRDDIAVGCDPHNIGSSVKSARWHEFLTRSPRWAQRFARLVIPNENWRMRFQKFLLRRNQCRPKCEPMNRELRARLVEELADDVARLGRLISRDLSHWSKSDARFIGGL